MKKILTLFLALTLLLSLTACTAGDRTPEEKKEDPTTVTEAAAPVEETTTEPAEAADDKDAEPKEDATETEQEGPAVNVVYDDARTLIDEFVGKLLEGKVEETEAMFDSEAFENYKLADLADAKPTVHEILWDDGFLELRLKDESYVTLDIEKNDNGQWLFEDIEATTKYFEKDGDVQLKQQGGEKWHFENLSGVPATQFQNAGEVILVPGQQKRILRLERWDDEKHFRSEIQLLEMNGTAVPANIFYKLEDSVINKEQLDASFGIYFYKGEDSLWIDRIVELLGIK